MAKKTITKKNIKEKGDEAVAQRTSSPPEAKPIEKIKQSFSRGVSEGRRALLKKLLETKGVETNEIQKLYSSGLMEPEMLEDLTLGDLVKASGIRMDLARIIKEIILRKESDLPFEYEKLEIDRLNRETKNIYLETENIRKEIEALNKKYDSMNAEVKTVVDERDKLRSTIKERNEEERQYYFNEKRAQDEMMFILKEQRAFKEDVDKYANNFGFSENELDSIKREFVFTKGECGFVLEKINFLVNKLDAVMEVKGVSNTKLSSFLKELKRVHDTLVDAYKKTSLQYYTNKQ